MGTIMVTMGRVETYKEWNDWIRFFRRTDCHKWIIAAETGANGYEHWQIRFKSRWAADQLTAALRQVYPDGRQIHTEDASDKWEYESKEGKYLASWDTMDARKQRFGKPRWAQKGAIEAVYKTNDREIVFWYDETGNRGKSWLTGHLFETGEAYYLPPYLTSVQSMIQTLASLVLADREAGNPPRPLVVIDIPRSWKWSTELYVAIEAIKDGLIMDPRYSARPINIRGCKVLVLTNTMPKLDKLSTDRWVQYDPILWEQVWGKSERALP